MKSALPLSVFVLSCVLCLISYVSPAQSWVWAQGEGGIGNDASNAVTTDISGNTYITGNMAGKADFSGTVYQGHGIYDVFVAKYDPAGNLLWIKLAGSSGNDQGNSIKWKNGYVYVCGSFSDTAFFENTSLISKGETDAFLAKYAETGNLIWVKSAGGTGTDYASSVDLDNTGNIFIAGTYEHVINVGGINLSTPSFYNESFYAKYDDNGNATWAKSTTGNNPNLITGIAFDNHNAVYLTGYYGGNFSIGNGTVSAVSSSYDIFLSKIGDNGNFEWLKRAGSTYEDGAHSVCCDADGNPSIAGYFAGTAYFDNNSVTYSDYNDVFVARYDTSGNNLWVRSGRGNKLDVAFSIASDANGNVVATGMFQNVIGFDGHTLTSHDILDRDIFLVSYDKIGNVRWLTRVGDLDTDCGLAVSIHANGNIAVSGYYLHTCIFGSIALDYADGNDLFIAKYNVPVVNVVDDLRADWNVSVYPNPCAANCQLLTADDQFSSLEVAIHNMIGEVLYQGRINANGELPTANFASGIYIVEISTAEKVKVMRLMKD